MENNIATYYFLSSSGTNGTDACPPESAWGDFWTNQGWNVIEGQCKDDSEIALGSGTGNKIRAVWTIRTDETCADLEAFDGGMICFADTSSIGVNSTSTQYLMPTEVITSSPDVTGAIAGGVFIIVLLVVANYFHKI